MDSVSDFAERLERHKAQQHRPIRYPLKPYSHAQRTLTQYAEAEG